MPSRFFGGMVGGATGGSGIFPVYLVKGDNGQVGIDLYNFFMQNYIIENYYRVYYFQADEICVINDPINNINDRIFECMYTSSILGYQYVYFGSNTEPSSEVIYLTDDGYLFISIND